MLTSFEQEQRVKRYATYDELLGYCANSANPVGRLVLYLCESFDEGRAALSDCICTGLQLANFWQDVRRDRADLGRVYLPEEDRRRFRFSDEDLGAYRFNPAFCELMKFEVERTRRLFETGRPLVALMPRAVRADIELFLEGGLAILRKIERAGYDVLSERPKLCKSEKARLLLRALIHSGSDRAVDRGIAPPLSPTVFPEAGETEIDSFPLSPASGMRAGVRGARLVPANSINSHIAHTNGSVSHFQPSINRSFTWCARLTRRTAGNFYWAFLTLPRAQRRAMEALYAFMRVTDDLADDAGEVAAKRAALRDWRAALDRCLAGQASHPLHPALRRIVDRYGIPPAHLHEVIDGVEMDLEPRPFATFAQLRGYCHRVASAVGLCCIQIWGFHDEAARAHAEAAGIAFQLTNILRDLGEDLDRGRVYLPLEDIERFRSPPESWRQRGGEFRDLMRFQAERAREHYRRAERLAGCLHPSGRAVFQTMLRTYRGLLDEIERRDYDVFRERVRLTRWRKLRHLCRAFPSRWGWQ